MKRGNVRMCKFKWENMLCSKRIRESNNAITHGIRNEFEADYDRIVGSSSVRRLQDKAQVYPLQANDFVRTRLTHSIEVSGIARSLGKQVATELYNINKIQQNQIDQIAAILQTVGLIHDIGNPPFGHFGEGVIKEWFRNNEKILEGLTDQEKNDFLHFDGNVQNFRVVTKLQMLNDLSGANFTFATLAVLMKYPWNSLAVDGTNKKKFGYYQSEENIVKQIRKITGLEEGIRHPLTYLLEAADDITYMGDDIEDGVKKKLIDWDSTYKKFCGEYGSDKEINDYIIKKIYNIVKNREEQFNDIPEKEIADSRNFRNLLQGYLIKKAKENFISNYDDIMNGKMNKKDLFEGDEHVNKIILWYKSLMKENCYSCDEILDLELAAHKVIGTMMDHFSSIINADANSLNDIENYNNRLLKSISNNYVYIVKKENKNNYTSFDEIPKYSKIQLCVDYIAGMTDSYAVRQYKKIMGISLSLKG